MVFHQQPWAEDIVGATRATIETYLRHFLRHWSHDEDIFTDEEVAEYVEAYSQPGAVRGGFNCYRAALRGAGQANNAPIPASTKVLWSDRDPILPFEWSDRLSEFFPNHTLKKIDGCGHFMAREAPERINNEIIEFLR
jgi:pimeloyl-ACP methyl ester carboxylesterase